jgi:Ca2+-binding EF-hand superfamily protein
MSKKAVILVAGGLLAAGAVVAISAPGHRGGGWHGGGHGMGRMLGMDGAMMGFAGPMGGRHGGRMGERMKALDADGDGAITLEEALAPVRDRFKRMDKDGNGSIEAADFAAHRAEAIDYWTKRILKRLDQDKDGKISKAEAERLPLQRFAVMDLNDDGVVDREDMGERRGRGGWRGRWSQGETQEGDSGPDAGPGSGPGSAAGSGPGHGRGGGGPRWGMSKERMQARIGKWFTDRDTDKDGFVDAKELTAAAGERGSRMGERFLRRHDTDKDGKVTLAEFEASAKERFAANDLDDNGKITEADLPPMLRGRGILK